MQESLEVGELSAKSCPFEWSSFIFSKRFFQVVSSSLQADSLILMKVNTRKVKGLREKGIWKEFEESATIWLFINSSQYPWLLIYSELYSWSITMTSLDHEWNHFYSSIHIMFSPKHMSRSQKLDNFQQVQADDVHYNVFLNYTNTLTTRNVIGLLDSFNIKAETNNLEYFRKFFQIFLRFFCDFLLYITSNNFFLFFNNFVLKIYYNYLWKWVQVNKKKKKTKPNINRTSKIKPVKRSIELLSGISASGSLSPG